MSRSQKLKQLYFLLHQVKTQIDILKHIEETTKLTFHFTDIGKCYIFYKNVLIYRLGDNSTLTAIYPPQKNSIFIAKYRIVSKKLLNEVYDILISIKHEFTYINKIEDLYT